MYYRILGASLGLLAIVGCESTTAMPYQASTQNVIAAQKAIQTADTVVSVGTFTASAGVAKPTCRMAGKLDIAPGKDIATFIRDAFESELYMTNAYDSEGTKIQGSIERVEVNTFGTGAWTIDATVSSNAYPDGYQVSSTHTFATSFSAYQACKNAAAAFNPAVSSLLGKIVNHPKFTDLVGTQSDSYAEAIGDTSTQ